MLKLFSIRLFKCGFHRSFINRFKLKFHHVFSRKPFLANYIGKPIFCTVKFNKTSHSSFYARKVLNKYKHLIKTGSLCL